MFEIDLRLVQPALLQQRPVPRERLDHVVPIRLEEMLEQTRFLRRRERFGCRRGQLVPEVVHLIVGQLLELLQQHGRQVERAPELGKLVRQPDHVEVALRRVQPHPRHQRRPADGVDVIRLVHVPEEGDVERHGSSPAAAQTTISRRYFAASSAQVPRARYLQKPYSPMSLARILREILGPRRGIGA